MCSASLRSQVSDRAWTALAEWKGCGAGKPSCMASFRKPSLELMENDQSDYLRSHIWVNNANQGRLLHEDKVLKMFVCFPFLGFKVLVAFYVENTDGKLCMSFCDRHRGLTREQWLKTATGTTKALRQKTATCQRSCCIWSSTLTFPCSTKICIAISNWKAIWQELLMETWASCIQIEWALMPHIYWTICFLRSQLVFLFPIFFFLPLFWCSDT